MSQRRFTPATLIAGLAASAALLLPGMASAAGYIHPANNEAGAVVHPEHFKSSKTRQEVINELINETPAQRDARQRAMGG